ncbi:2-amino-1-hydroxyethylphosphonate dioxygenase (glycine-forming)-like [Panulirus ornatus]|uniref:2-amino-1-hydroxyethylphosphonate dioxygenase (glycine-forming)-like n=1 Tax=Panulirus ornatus TaxID=150431 RepID=UPI003A8709E7
MEPEAAVQDVFSLFDDFGQKGYLGEDVSQVQHALQAARLAETEGFSVEMVLAALLHDIGHLLGMREGEPRIINNGVTFGAVRHEVIGEEYLRGLGFPPAVTNLVRNHVNAKRFLVATDADYHDGLSHASKVTLENQGGPMTPQEVEEFRSHPQFKVILRMRSWDEKAKDPAVVTPSLQHYKELCLAYLKEHRQRVAAGGGR